MLLFCVWAVTILLINTLVQNPTFKVNGSIYISTHSTYLQPTCDTTKSPVFIVYITKLYTHTEGAYLVAMIQRPVRNSMGFCALPNMRSARQSLLHGP